MQVNANTTARIAFTWNERAKAWDITATGGDGKRTWIVTKRATTRIEIDKVALTLLVEQCSFCLESWLW